MATSKHKGLDEPTLEGGIGGAGAGYRSAKGASDSIKQFETLSPIEQKAMEKVRKYKPTAEDTALGKQFETLSPIQQRAMEKLRAHLEGKKKGGVVSASKRADGIAARGKTRGRLV